MTDLTPTERAELEARVASKEAFPIRQASAHGEPKPNTSIERRCGRCGASFLGLAPGKTGERGLWTVNLTWYCSQECFDA